jgi:hypothetical protein
MRPSQLRDNNEDVRLIDCSKQSLVRAFRHLHACDQNVLYLERSPRSLYLGKPSRRHAKSITYLINGFLTRTLCCRFLLAQDFLQHSMSPSRWVLATTGPPVQSAQQHGTWRAASKPPSPSGITSSRVVVRVAGKRNRRICFEAYVPVPSWRNPREPRVLRLGPFATKIQAMRAHDLALLSLNGIDHCKRDLYLPKEDYDREVEMLDEVASVAALTEASAVDWRSRGDEDFRKLCFWHNWAQVRFNYHG